MQKLTKNCYQYRCEISYQGKTPSRQYLRRRSVRAAKSIPIPESRRWALFLWLREEVWKDVRIHLQNFCRNLFPIPLLTDDAQTISQWRCTCYECKKYNLIWLTPESIWLGEGGGVWNKVLIFKPKPAATKCDRIFMKHQKTWLLLKASKTTSISMKVYKVHKGTQLSLFDILSLLYLGWRIRSRQKRLVISFAEEGHQSNWVTPNLRTSDNTTSSNRCFE